MKAGAIDFLTKPFRDQDILDAMIRAIERDQKRRDSEKAVSELRMLFDSLTSREREVMTQVAAGLMNKADRGQIRHHRDYCEGPIVAI